MLPELPDAAQLARARADLILAGIKPLERRFITVKQRRQVRHPRGIQHDMLASEDFGETLGRYDHDQRRAHAYRHMRAQSRSRKTLALIADDAAEHRGQHQGETSSRLPSSAFSPS